MVKIKNCEFNFWYENNEEHSCFIFMFNYNPEKRMITCIIDPVKDEEYIESFDKTAIDAYFVCNASFVGGVLVSESTSDKYIGKAVCSEEDEFNEEYGKILAFKRAYERYHWHRTKSITKCTNDVIENIKEASGNTIKLMNHQMNYIYSIEKSFKERIEK